MALSKVFSFLALNGLALSAIISTPAPSDAFLTTTTQTGVVRETITLASGLVGVVDGTVLVLANTTLTPAPTAYTVGHHTISLGSDRVVVVDGETTTLPSPGDAGDSSSQPSTTVESSETELSGSTGSSDTPQDTPTTTTGSAQSGSADLPTLSDTTSGSGRLTTSDGLGSDSTTEPTSTTTGPSSDSTPGFDSGSTSEPSPISDGQDVTQSVSQTTSETTTISPITGTVTEAPAGFSTELITNSHLTTNTWITTTKDDQETVVPVLVGCPGCGGAFGGIILWGLPSITNVAFNLPGLPSFYLPCIQVLGASIGQCTQGPSDPPEDNKPDPSSRPDDKTKTKERETSASSSTCDATETATDVFVACSTGSADGSATTTCTTSTRIVTGCSVSGSTTTSLTGGVCLLRPTPDARGPIGTYSFQGYVPFSLPDITGTVSEIESSTTSSTESTVESSTVSATQPPTSTSFSTLISTTSSTTLPPRVPAPAITMTTTATPECVQGYQTYTMTAVASAPANADSIRVFIPEADRPGMKWEVSLPPIQFFGVPIDVRGNIRSWRVGTSDEGTTLASGDGGKDMSIKWETPRDKDGTYVEFFFTSDPPLGPQVFRVVAQSDGRTCMPSHCNDPPTITTDKDGLVCTLRPCSHHPICSQGPVTPRADCLVLEDGFLLSFFFQITIITNNWVTDNGEKLKKEEKGCGAITEWNVRKINREVADGSWTATHEVTFTLPLTIKAGCVERAIASAGGPSGLKCFNSVSDWVL